MIFLSALANQFFEKIFGILKTNKMSETTIKVSHYAGHVKI